MADKRISYTLEIDAQIGDLKNKLDIMKKAMEGLDDSAVNSMFEETERILNRIQKKATQPITSKGMFTSLEKDTDAVNANVALLEKHFNNLTNNAKLDLIDPEQAKLIREAATALGNMGASAKQSSADIANTEKQMEQLARRIETTKSRIAGKEATLVEAQGNRNNITQNISNLENQQKTRDSQRAALEKELEASNKAYEGKDKRTKIDGARRPQDIKKDLDKLGTLDKDDAAQLAKYKAELKQTDSEIKKLENSISTSNTTLKNQQNEYNVLKDKLGEYKLALQQAQQTGTQEEFDQLRAAAERLGISLDDIGDSYTPEDVEKLTQRIQQQTQAIIKNDAKMNKAEETIKDTSQAADKLGDNVREGADAFDQMSQEARDLDNIKNRMQSLLGYEGISQVIRRVWQDAMQTIKELDATMTEMAVVTDASIGDYWNQLPEYTKRASELGVTINDAYKASTLFYQQGLKTNEVIGLSNETLKMARIAGLDTADATDKMTAALRGFNMELTETNAQRVSDVYSELAAVTAADTAEIANAMTKTASIASSAGMEFETTAAFLSQIIETTRESAETAGTAMKTIIARFQELKKAPGEIGEVDGEVIDANKIETALRTVGVSLRDASGQFRALDDVFLELAGKWDGLDKNTQRYIATIAAGSRQQSRFIAMMSDYGRTQELVAAANDSAGASNQQFEKTMDSLDAKMNKLTNSWHEFTMGIFESDLLKGGVDILTKLVDILNEGTSAVGGLFSSFSKVALIYTFFKIASSVFQKISVKASQTFKNITADAIRQAKKGGEDSGKEGGDAAKKALEGKGKEASRLFWRNFKDFGTQTVEQQTAAFQSFGDTASNVGLTFSMLGGLVGQFSEEAGEAISGVSNGIMILGMSVSLLAPLTKVVATAIKNHWTTAANHTTVAWIAAWAAITLGAAAVIALLVALVGAINGGNNELEKLTESTESAKTAAEEAKKAYSEMLDDQSKFEDAQEALEKLTYGTDEWKKKLAEVNQQVLDLLDKYPDLAAYVSRGEDGQLTILDEGWDALLEKQTKVMTNTKMLHLDYQRELMAAQGKSAEEIANFTEAALTVAGGETTANSEYGASIVGALAEQYGTTNVEKREAEILSGIKEGKDYKDSPEFMRLANEYGVGDKMTGKSDEKDMQTLYMAMAGMKSVDEIPETLRNDARAMRVEIAKMAAGKEQVDGQNELIQQIDTIAATDKDTADKIAGAFDPQAMSSELAESILSENGFDANELAASLGWSIDKLASALGMDINNINAMLKKNAKEGKRNNDKIFNKLNFALETFGKENQITSIGTDLSLQIKEGLAEKLIDISNISGDGTAIGMASFLDKILKANIENEDLIGNLLAGINWTDTAEWDSFLDALEANNITITSEIEEFIEAAKEASNASISLSMDERVAQGKTIRSLVNELQNNNGILTDDLYKQLTNVNKELADNFLQLDDGSWVMLEGNMKEVIKELGWIEENTAKDTKESLEAAITAGNLLTNFSRDYKEYATKDEVDKLTTGGKRDFLNDYFEYLDKAGQFSILEKLTDEQGKSLNLGKGINPATLSEDELERIISALFGYSKNTKDLQKKYNESRIQDFADFNKVEDNVLKANEFRMANDEDWKLFSKAILLQARQSGMVANEIIEKYSEELSKKTPDAAELFKLEKIMARDISKAIENQEALDAVLDLEERVATALEQERQEEIDKLSEINDSVNDLNSQLIEKIQQQIDEDRQARENEKTEQEIADARSKRSYLAMDTSGANALQLLDLDKSIAEQEQSYQDSLIDQALQKLQDANDEAAEQREEQIRLMEEQLASDLENGVIAEQAGKIVKDSLDKIRTGTAVDATKMGQLLDKTETTNLTNLAKENWVESLQKVASQASQWFTTLGYEPIGGKPTFTPKLPTLSPGTTSLNGYGGTTLLPKPSLQKTLAIATGGGFDSGGSGGNEYNWGQNKEQIQNASLVESALNGMQNNSRHSAAYWDAEEDVQNALEYFANQEGKEDITETEYFAKNIKPTLLGITGGSVDHVTTANNGWTSAEAIRGGHPFKLYYDDRELGEFQYSNQNYTGTTDIGKALNNIVGENRETGWVAMYDEVLYALKKEPGENEMWYKNSNTELDKAYLALLRGGYSFKTGGLADFTGPAWLDGTKTRPEYVLNAAQTERFFSLIDILDQYDTNPTSSGKSGDNYFDININVDQISDDYDVEQLADKVRELIYEDASYRNVNSVRLIR